MLGMEIALFSHWESAGLGKGSKCSTQRDLEAPHWSQSSDGAGTELLAACYLPPTVPHGVGSVRWVGEPFPIPMY